MALPTTGPLSINDIRVELGASATNQSLGTFSDTAGFAAPDAITDFYGFSNLQTFYVNPLLSVCTANCTTPFYHQGSSGIPSAGDIIYTNSSLTTTASTGIYPAHFVSGTATVLVNIGGRGLDPGEVSTVTFC
jgi:hypothetical protein|tara:strand:- start:32 stop:430 length:399 start_codon:yes stop_codon:yes gene_type:complete